MTESAAQLIKRVKLLILRKRREIGAVLFVISFVFVTYAIFLLAKWTNGDF